MKHVFGVGSVGLLLSLQLMASPEASTATGNLAVASDPQQAGVYVDGRFAGRTPITLTSLAAGDHRVRIVKDGYLENVRLVSVGAARAVSLRVLLTRHAPSRLAAGQVEIINGENPEHHSKWPWIVAGAATAGVGGYLAVKPSSTSAPGSSGNPGSPVAGAVAAAPANGLAASTTIGFSVSGASDPDGDPLTFSWDFGDGSKGSGANPTHIYNAAGPYLATVTVSDGKTAASATGGVTVKSLAGTWKGTLVGGGTTTNTTVVFNQSGAGLSGTYADGGLTNGTVSGFVATSSPTVTFTVTTLLMQFTFTGNPGPDINTLSGFANGSGFTNAPWTLTRQ